MDTSMTWALNLKQMVEEGLVPYKNIFKEMQKPKKKSRRNCDVFSWSCAKCTGLSCLSFHLLLALSLPPCGQQDQPLLFLSLLDEKTRRKIFMIIHFHLTAPCSSETYLLCVFMWNFMWKSSNVWQELYETFVSSSPKYWSYTTSCARFVRQGAD